MSRSLISAGAESVIASLWKVPDNTMAPLMVEFYRNWQRNPDKAVAEVPSDVNNDETIS